ncbi:MAG: ABC transporter permease [Saprospiraceae bacterium]|nr:ABC transporter permease [Saprospiraceae bacterium]
MTNFSIFIARRIALSGGKNFSRLIIRIAVIAVALSVAVMVSASALIAGFKSEISRKIFEFWGHIHISDTAYSLSFEPKPVSVNQSFYPELNQVKTIPEAYLSRIGLSPNAIHGGVKHIQAFAHKPGIIRTKTALEGILLKGVGTDFDWSHLTPYLLEGSSINTSDTLPSKDIIISQQTAQRLQVKVGDKFVLHFVKENDQLRRLFQVSGIYRTGLEEYDRKFAICDIRQVQNLLGWDSTQVAGFEIWLDDLRDLEVYNQYIDKEELPQELLSVTIRDKFPSIFEWLELQDYNEVVILGLMLVVAIINMITALLVLVLERTNMIGILKALGARNRPIQSVFVYHASMITIWGMFWGNLIGLSFCFLQDKFKWIRLNEADYYLSYAPIKINWTVVAGINLGTLLITSIFLLLPSLVIASIAPVKAIRFK